MAVMLQIQNASKSYGSQVLLDEAEATLTDGVKYGFVGRNGAGKSTLLRILLGEEELDRGEVIRSPKLQIGYLRQHDPFQPGETTLEFLMRERVAQIEFEHAARLDGVRHLVPEEAEGAAAVGLGAIERHVGIFQ